MSRVLIAFVTAAVVASVAWLLHLLTATGAAAAAVVGTAALLRGVDWIVLILVFFTSSSALSRWRASERDALMSGIAAKGSRRDAMQVLANGGVFTVAAFLAAAEPTTAQAVAAGALAAATADTWSTEVGTVLGRAPIDLRSGRPVAPGTSGAVSIPGLVAGVLGALLIALVVVVVGWGVDLHAIIAGGVIGFLVDSALGATIQEQRWCGTCSTRTERRTHSCGTPTVHHGGLRGWTNDMVNLSSTIAGAGVTWTLT